MDITQAVSIISVALCDWIRFICITKGLNESTISNVEQYSPEKRVMNHTSLELSSIFK